jgi:hypothetical protein
VLEKSRLKKIEAKMLELRPKGTSLISFATIVPKKTRKGQRMYEIVKV